MPRFAANLSMLYTEVPFLDRFERAARSGFDAVEFLFPYPFPAAEIKARLQGNGLALALVTYFSVIATYSPLPIAARRASRLAISPASISSIVRL